MCFFFVVLGTCFTFVDVTKGMSLEMFKKRCRIELALLLCTSHQTIFRCPVFKIFNIFTVSEIRWSPPSLNICLCRRQRKTLTLLTKLLDRVILYKQCDISSYKKSDCVRKTRDLSNSRKAKKTSQKIVLYAEYPLKMCTLSGPEPTDTLQDFSK